MAKAKWIGGFLGLLSGGPIGALAGFVLGALFDKLSDDNGMIADDSGYDYSGYDSRGYARSGGSYANSGSYSSGGSDGVDYGTRNGFLFSMLTLASYIIRADGKIMHSEMETMRTFLRQNFGQTAVDEGNAIMLKLFEEQKRMEAQSPGSYRQVIIEACGQLRRVLNRPQRLQLLQLLAMLAKADGTVVREEIAALREVTTQLGLDEAELNSMLNLGTTTLDAAYAVLEIEPTATDDEVRAAYKRMVVKHHPDRVASLGEDIKAAAEKKMREINEAKELIYKARGL